VKNTRLLILLLFSLVFSSSLKADMVSLIRADQCETIIEVYIEEDHVRVTFEIGKNDFEYFRYIIPETYFDGGMNDANRTKYLQKFYNETFLLKANGEILPGELGEVKRNDRNYRASLYTNQVDTANSKISSWVVFAEMKYKVKKPETISVTPPILTGYSTTLANIGFVTYHKGLPVHDLRYMATEETLHLNWNDPWYSKYENKNLVRHHQNSLMSFLYVDPYEIRHEMLIRLKDLEEWIEFDYHIDDDIPSEDMEAIKNEVADFLMQKNPLKADGETIEPILDKSHFVEVKLSGIQILQEPKSLPFSSAIIGVIFVYPHDSIPNEVSVKWDLWGEKLQRIPSVMTDPVGPMPYDLMPGDSMLVWKNYLKNYEIPTVSKVEITKASFGLPVFTIILLVLLSWLIIRVFHKKKRWNWKRITGATLLVIFSVLLFPFWIRISIPFLEKKSFSIPEANALVSDLLHNTYRAFDFREEGDVYDKLELCNTGDLLAEIYIQTKKSMVLENQGGIQVKLRQVDVTNVKDADVEDLEKNALAFKCEWIVEGDVGHWGHIHRRVNQYQALVKIKPVDGSWKMYDLEIIEETRKI
jgi:hypothetical protein